MGLAEEAEGCAEALLSRVKAKAAIDDKKIVEEVVDRDGEKHTSEGTYEVRKSVKVEDTTSKAEVVPVKVVVLGTAARYTPDCKYCELRRSHRDLAVGSGHVVQTEGEGEHVNERHSTSR